MLDKIDVKDKDVVIDVGANIGEIYKYFKFKNIIINYFAFEPNYNDYLCLKKNTSGNLNNFGILSKPDKLPFNSITDTADSSFIYKKKKY